MNKQNDEFEAFLKQFRLRRHGPLPATAGRSLPHLRRRWAWGLAAAAATIAVLTAAFWIDSASDGAVYATVDYAAGSRYRAGERVDASEAVRAAFDGNLGLSLEAGPRLEVRAQSEIVLESDGEKVILRLRDGAVLVTASGRQQHALEVWTREAQASSTGTVYVVEAGPDGTRVGVLEGEIQFWHDDAATPLRAGDSATTNPSMGERTLAEMIVWSRRAVELAALLPPPPAQSPQAEIVALPQEQQERSTPEQDLSALLAAARSARQQNPPPSPSPNPPAEQPGSDADGDADAALAQGRRIFERACGQCHNLNVAAARFGTRDEYAALIAKERRMGALVSDAEAPLLIDYLFRTFRPVDGFR